jgi:hypothetical protein
VPDTSSPSKIPLMQLLPNGGQETIQIGLDPIEKMKTHWFRWFQIDQATKIIIEFSPF